MALMAAAATGVIGLAALAIETSNWYVQKAELQRVADSAAIAGAIEYVKTYTSIAGTTYTAAAQAYALQNGVPTANIAVSVVAAPNGDGNSAIKVTATKTLPLMLARVISSSTSVTITADAYAELQSLFPPCVEALAPTGNDINVTGNVTLTGCSLWSKSNSVGTAQNSASVSLGGNSTMTANVYTPGSIYVGGSSAFTGHKYSVTQSAITDFIGAKSAVTTALGNVTTVQGLAAPTTPNVSGSSTTWTAAAGSCTQTITGPQSYSGLTINNTAGACSPYVVNLSGNFIIGSGGITVNGNVVVNFGPGTDTINGAVDLSGQTGGCFGLGTDSSTTTCSPSTTSGTYYVAAGSGSNNGTSIKNGAGMLAVGPGTFWSGGDLVLTGSGNVNWHPPSAGASTTKIAGSVTLGTATYIFGAGVYQIKSDFSFANSSGSLTFNGSSTASSLITIGGTSNGGGLNLGHNGASDTYSYSFNTTTIITAQAPTLRGQGTGTHSLVSPCTQTSSSTCAANLTGSGIAGLLLAVPQAYTGTVNVPSANNGSITVGGMVYGKAATLNLQGNASNSGCFGFVVSVATLSGTASFSSCNALTAVALGVALAE